MNKIILTGLKPTGNIHLGNYFGALKQFIDLQNEMLKDSKTEFYLFVADLHSFSDGVEKKELKKDIYNLIRSFVALGANPKKIILYRQSDFPEITELYWILGTLFTYPQLALGHAWKDKTTEQKSKNLGVLMYPVLMAADILIMNSNKVPIGQDQLQHLEYTREVARKFNTKFGKTFTEPKELILKEVAIIPGTDGNKMSKSKKNTIQIFADEKAILKSVMSIVTKDIGLGGKVDITKCNLCAIYRHISTPQEFRVFSSNLATGKKGYADSKKILYKKIIEYFSEARKKYKKISDTDIEKILNQGVKKVKPIVEKNLKVIKKATGL